MKIGEVAKISGVTVRTLHYYDEIGLLKPNILVTKYRDYTEEHLKQLQQILFYRELEFPLDSIKEIIQNPTFDYVEKLHEHYEQLTAKKNHIEGLLQLVIKTIQAEKGEMEMTMEQKFQGFNFNNNPYEQEAKEKWGAGRVEKTNSNIMKSPEFQNEMNNVFNKFVSVMNLEPSNEKVQEVTDEWFKLLNTVGTYSLEAFTVLGLMYVEDERFSQNINQFSDGLATFVNEAMEYYSIINTK